MFYVLLPVEDSGGVPWSSALAVRFNSVSSFTSERSEVNTMSPVSLLRLRYSEAPDATLDGRDETCTAGYGTVWNVLCAHCYINNI